MVENLDTAVRVRAWVLGNTGDLQKFKENIQKDFPGPSVWTCKKFFEIGGDDYVIVRADVVDLFYIGTDKCNIIIPVDAKDETTLDNAKIFLETEFGIQIFATVKVQFHNPWSPHRAHGYITQLEYDDLNDDNVGRQSHKSPGSNKWG